MLDDKYFSPSFLYMFRGEESRLPLCLFSLLFDRFSFKVLFLCFLCCGTLSVLARLHVFYINASSYPKRIKCDERIHFISLLSRRVFGNRDKRERKCI